jgi:anti-anti-sigma factor
MDSQALRLGVCETPVACAAMVQWWDELTFLHWRYSPDEVQRLLPPGLEVLLAAGDRHLVLDVSQVEYWDSSAVRSLVALAQNVGRHGGHLVVTGNPRMAHVMERAGLSQLVFAASDVGAGVSAAAETSTGPAPAPGRS